MPHEEENGRVSFEISPGLLRRLHTVIDLIRSQNLSRDETAEAVIDIIMELTDAGMDYYYMRPLRTANAGIMTRGATSMGLKTSYRGIYIVAKRIVGNMSHDQLSVIADHFEEILGEK